MLSMHRNGLIDFQKGILIALVVLGHCIQYIFYSGSDSFFDNIIFKLIYMFHMPAFMFISGALAVNSIATKPLSKIISEKFSQLFIPLVFWSIPITILSSFIFGKYDLLSLLKNFASSIIHHYWFLWDLAFCYVFFKIIYGLNGISRLVAVTIVWIVLGFVPYKISSIVNLGFVLPFFYFGMLSTIRSNRKIGSNSSTFLIILAYLINYIYWDRGTYIYNNKMNLTDITGLFELVKMVTGAALATFLFLQVSQITYNRLDLNNGLSEIIVNMGRKTINIYLIQEVVFFAIDGFKFAAEFNFFDRILLSVLIMISIYLSENFLLKFFDKFLFFRKMAFGR